MNKYAILLFIIIVIIVLVLYASKPLETFNDNIDIQNEPCIIYLSEENRDMILNKLRTNIKPVVDKIQDIQKKLDTLQDELETIKIQRDNLCDSTRYRICSLRPVSASSFHYLILKKDGTVSSSLIFPNTFQYGQTLVGAWSDIISVSAGRFHSLGLRFDKTVVSTSINLSGIYAILGKTGQYMSASDLIYGQDNVSAWKNIITISAGMYHSLGLKSDGTVISTSTRFGDTGQTEVGTWTDIVDIAAGSVHSLGLKSDGTVVSTTIRDKGSYYYIGSLGQARIFFDKVGGNTAIPNHINLLTSLDHGQTDVGGWTDIVAIATPSESRNNFYSMGLRSDGTVVTTDAALQNKISGWKNVSAISAGEFHCMGLRSDGVILFAMLSHAVIDTGQTAMKQASNYVAIETTSSTSFGITSSGDILMTKIVNVQRQSNSLPFMDNPQMEQISNKGTTNIMNIGSLESLDHPSYNKNCKHMTPRQGIIPPPEPEEVTWRVVKNSFDNNSLTFTRVDGTGPSSMTFGPFTNSFKTTITKGTKYKLSGTNNSGPGRLDLRLDGNTIRVDDRSGYGGDRDFNDLTVTPDKGRFIATNTYELFSDTIEEFISSKQTFCTLRPISASSFHYLVLQKDGNVSSALIFPNTFQYGQTLIDTWSDIKAISAGRFHSLGLKTDNTVISTPLRMQRVYAILSNTGQYMSASDLVYGQDNVADWKNIISISAGMYHSLGLKSDGTVISTSTRFGDTGQTDVSTWTDIVDIAAGSVHSLGLKSDGTVVSTTIKDKGSYYYIGSLGQARIFFDKVGSILNIPNHKDRFVKLDHGQTDVGGWTNIVAIATPSESRNNFYSMGLRSDGTVITTVSALNSKVSSWTSIISISAGEFHCMGLRSDGIILTAMLPHAMADSGQREIEQSRGYAAIEATSSASFGASNTGDIFMTKIVNVQSQSNSLPFMDNPQDTNMTTRGIYKIMNIGILNKMSNSVYCKQIDLVTCEKATLMVEQLEGTLAKLQVEHDKLVDSIKVEQYYIDMITKYNGIPFEGFMIPTENRFSQEFYERIKDDQFVGNMAKCYSLLKNSKSLDVVKKEFNDKFGDSVRVDKREIVDENYITKNSYIEITFLTNDVIKYIPVLNK